MQNHGVEIVFLNHIMGTSPEEDLLLQMQGMFAEYERAKILKRFAAENGMSLSAVRSSVTTFLEDKLHLKVNRQKSAVDYIQKRKFLGHRLLAGGKLGVAPASLRRVKARIRQITHHNRGISLDRPRRTVSHRRLSQPRFVDLD